VLNKQTEKVKAEKGDSVWEYVFRYGWAQRLLASKQLGDAGLRPSQCLELREIDG
jgi:hypothetical protein